MVWPIMPMLLKFLCFQRSVLGFSWLVSRFFGYWVVRGDEQMVIIEANGGFHLKGYSKVSFKDGKPLEKLRADGTPLRIQQSVLLARKNEQYPSKSHWRVQEVAVAKQRQIEEWERAAETTAESVAPSGEMTVTAFY